MSLIIQALLSSFLFINPVLAQAPHVDFDRMGRVALVGAFAGLDIFQNNSAPYDPATSTLFSRNAQGALTRLASTSTGGRILAGCQLDDTFYFAGLFSSVDGIDASNIASYSPSNNKFSALAGGVNGEVEALFCDTKERKVWVGGSFSSPAAAVAIWNPRSSEWEQPPFGGLNGAQAKVSSITTNTTDASIFFAGSFVTNFGTPRPLNASGNPNVPNSPGASPFSTSLVPIPLQSIPGVEIIAGPSSSQTGFGDIRNILCPAGDDGPGNTWLAEDGSAAVITIRAFSFISASGLRLGNTFQNDRGTTSFSVTTIPDNGPRELRYVDPVSGENRTCTESCPLSTDSNVLYQDFLFDDALPITGVEIRLTGFNGASSGLHILQLLSSGAFASALEENNGVSCYAPNGSDIQRAGDWAVKVANTEIAGTIQRVLVSSVQPGTPVASRPTFTWIPYVGAAGNYDIYMLVPGCTNFQDCERRTSVQVVVFPGEGLAPNVMTVPQQNRDDTPVKIYSGPILPSSPEFVTTITMSLPDDPAGPVDIVADRVQLVLRSANASLSDSGNGSTTGSQRGFGFLEWPRDLSVTGDATNALPNTTITALDSVGFDMLEGLGGRLANGPLSVNAVAHHSSGAIFLGGNFNLSSGSASGASNIAVFRDGALASLADGGLDGAVNSFVLQDDLLFVGGAFRDTSAGSTSGRLRGVAVYNVKTNAWNSLSAGVNGQVTKLGSLNGRIQVAGNFTQLLSSESDFSIPAGGLAAWDVGSSSWVNVGGFAAGRMTLVADGPKDAQFVAGNVVSARQYGASGMILLQNGNDPAVPQVTPLGAELGSGPRPAGASSSNSAARRHLKERAKRSWVSHLHLPSLFARQSPPTTLPALPAFPISPAPAVLAGTFWKNGSSEVAIMGGNFTFFAPGSTTASQGVAIYNPDSSTVRGLNGDQPNGVIRSILVDGDNLFVGGEFTLASNNVNGIAIYNLARDEWDLAGLQALQAGSGSSVVVRSITKSPADDSTIIVAGSFTQAGPLRCQAICSLNVASKQWDSLGSGVNGEVASITYAGDVLYAGGSLMLENSAMSNVLQYTFGNSSWTPVGGNLPGPVTAIELNNGNSSSIFAAGSEESGAPFLAYWDGSNWSSLESTLGPDTSISQIAMVPLQNNHDEQGVIQSDRVLMVSGSLVDSTHGNVSAALYDGKNIIPYIIASTSSGSSGYISSLFRSVAKFSFDQRKFLAVGVVILISIAIAAGVVFLLALIGILWTLFARKDDKSNKFEGDENEEDSTHHRPSSLLEHINAATRTTIMGATSPYNDYSDKDDKSRSEHDPFGPDAGGFARAETPSDMAGGLMAEEMSRPAHARYSFDGHGEGELPISAGEELEVLDDRDPAWWYARHVRTGREGVVPASYLY